MDVIEYMPTGVCSKFIQVKIENNIIKDINFTGGCMGNLLGIKALVVGMDINDVIRKLNGIDCGGKKTSCPDQLSRCLLNYLKEKTIKISK